MSAFGSQRRFYGKPPRDPYGVLGLKPGASEADIKKAYRNAAKKWHPDRHPEDKRKEAEQKFKEVSEAYQQLTNPEPEGPQGFPGGHPGAGFPGGGFPFGAGQTFVFRGGFPGGGFPGGFPFGGSMHRGGGPVNIGDIFADLFESLAEQERGRSVSEGDAVEVTRDIRLMSMASRQSQLDKADDKLRAQSLGLSGIVEKINTRNNSAKVKIPGVGSVWIPGETLQRGPDRAPKQDPRAGGRQQQQRRPAHQDGTQVMEEKSAYMRGQDGRMWKRVTRILRKPNGEIVEESFMEPVD